jgi:hypothetical protein
VTIVSHDALLDALHVHPAPVFTENAPVPPTNVNDRLSGDALNVHPGGGVGPGAGGGVGPGAGGVGNGVGAGAGGAGVVTLAWVTGKAWPAATIVALRGAALGLTDTDT